MKINLKQCVRYHSFDICYVLPGKKKQKNFNRPSVRLVRLFLNAYRARDPDSAKSGRFDGQISLKTFFKV